MSVNNELVKITYKIIVRGKLVKYNTYIVIMQSCKITNIAYSTVCHSTYESLIALSISLSPTIEYLVLYIVEQLVYVVYTMVPSLVDGSVWTACSLFFFWDLIKNKWANKAKLEKKPHDAFVTH